MKYKIARSVPWAVGVLLLSGCASQNAAVSSKTPLPQPVAIAAPPAAVAPADLATAVSKPTVLPQRKPLFDMATLVGLDENGVRNIFGEPTTIADTLPGKTWRYQSRACAVNIAFYPDVKSRNFHVLSYEVTSDDRSTGADRHCRTQFATLASKK
jgi:hypothetical protein